MNLAELQKEAHAIAQDQGWYDTESTFGEFIALIHSELSGALEAYRERGFDIWVEPRVVEKDPRPPAWERAAFTHDLFSKPCGVASELAGVVIRVAGMAEHYGYDLTGWEEVDARHNIQSPSFGDWIAVCHSCLSGSFASWATTFGHEVIVECLQGLLRFTHLMADHYDIDLDAAIAAKMEYYRTGPHRRVGKVL